MSARPATHTTPVAALLALLLAGCGAATAPASPAAPSDPGTPGSPDAADARVPQEVLDALDAGGHPDLLVILDDAPERNPTLAMAESRLPIGAQEQQENADLRAEAFDQLKMAVLSDATPDVEVKAAYSHLPVMHLRVGSRAALEALLAQGLVARVEPNRLYQTTLAESLPFIGQPAAAAAGSQGEGTTVVVLDTGLDYRRAAFGSCTAPGVPASCRVAYVRDFAAEDGVLDAGNFHGTNVSGIVAAVAPRARLIGLDVFQGAGAYSTDIIAAINWAVANRAAYNIAAINMSLGGGSSSAPCAGDVFAPAVRAARAAGILSAIASGNNSFTNQLSSPACVPEAVSVGAVYDGNLGSGGPCGGTSTAADQVTCFSNSASFLSILAPGAGITAAGIAMSGTSQATPHVAGALAVLRAAYPNDSADALLARLLASGKPVTDQRNGVVTPRLDLAAAASGACSQLLSTGAVTLPAAGGSATVTLTTGPDCAWTASTAAGWLSVTPASGTGSASLVVAAPASGGAVRSDTLSVGNRSVAVTQGADTTAPGGSLVIAGGATYTRSLAVALTIQATDPAGVAAMCLSNSTSCTAWEAYAISRSWSLAAGASGARTVSIWFRDTRGNASAAPFKASITYDVTTPTGGAIGVSGGDGQVALTWTGFADAHSGVAGYRVSYAAGAAPASCTAGTLLSSGTATSAAATGLVNGTTYGFRACALDGAGNLSAGVTTTGRPAPEFVAPTGSVAINGGAASTASLSVTLAIPASDASGVALMCVSNGTTCSWEPYAATRAWALAAGASGARTVSVWFKDAWGNVQTTAARATIAYDVTAPIGGAVTATGADGQVSLSWSGFSDALSGVASYRVVAGTAGAPATCSAGTLLHAGTATSTVATGLTNGTTYGFRVCAVDRAGNVSAGATATSRPAPEFVAPTGSVTIGGAAFTASLPVTLAIQAADASGVAFMCLSNAATCTTWEPYAATRAWTLAAGTTGLRTVSLWLRDAWGNTSAAPLKATITYDVTAPTGGALTTAGADGRVTLSWSGFSDAHSGVAGYRVAYAAGGAPASCAAGTLLYAGTATSTVAASLANGTTYGFRVCGVDGAGNVSAGVTATGRPAPEFVAPTGSVAINGGATATASLSVTLAIPATDASGVALMCVSNTSSCSWEPYAATRAWTLATGASGARTVSVWFKDAWGNVQTTAAKATIAYDVAPPTGGTLTLGTSGGAVTLSWSGFSDPVSGIASYTVAGGTATAPATCTAAGAALATSSATTWQRAGLTPGATVAYRVCATDRAGNTSLGVVKSIVVK